jgi:hypothetical protein
MFERAISPDEVKDVVTQAEMIEEYPGDIPFPSILILGFVDKRPVHVVAAVDKKTDNCYVITVYIPDASIWSDDFRTRRSS